MADTRINHVVTGTITLATGNLTQAHNAPRGAMGIELYGTGASPPTWQFTPLLRTAFHYDDSAGTYTDGTAALSSRVAAYLLTLNDLEATNDFLYFGSATPFRGIYLNIGNTNTTASTDLAATYWDGAAWTGLTETDGTATGGISFALDNVVTWTMPTDWAKVSVNGSTPLFFVRFNFDATFDSTVTLLEAIPLSVQTNRPSSLASTLPLNRYWFDRTMIGGIEAVGDNADTLVVTWLCTSAFNTVTAE